MQPKFSYAAPVGAIALFAAIVGGHRLSLAVPDRVPAPAALAPLQLEPIATSAADFAPLVPVGAWRLSSPEPRLGGVSALAIDGEELLAVTDAGAVLRLSKHLRRRMQVYVADLPDGPGDPRFKMNRDSEAILRDADGRGWWVAFENRDQLWLFDRAFGRTLERVDVPERLLRENSGIEALAGGAGDILAFPEDGGSVLRWSGGRWSETPLDSRTGVSGAVQIDGGRILLLERRVTVTGFRNALAVLQREGASFRTIWRKRLPVAWRDNLEALAAERRADGGYRLWMMSDDNFDPRLRTVLLVVDVPADALPKRL